MPQDLCIFAEDFLKLRGGLIDDVIVRNHIDDSFFLFCNRPLQRKLYTAKRFPAAGRHMHQIDFRILLRFGKSLFLQAAASPLQFCLADKCIQPPVYFIQALLKIRL